MTRTMTHEHKIQAVKEAYHFAFRSCRMSAEMDRRLRLEGLDTVFAHIVENHRGNWAIGRLWYDIMDYANTIWDKYPTEYVGRVTADGQGYLV
jgi:hypothetical protein